LRRGAALVVAAVVVVAITAAWMLLRDRPAVEVQVRNASQRPIASVQLIHEAGEVTSGAIAVGAVTTLGFDARGETSFKLRVRFRDGSALVGGGGYAEPGYRFSETVTDEGISSETKVSGDY
jgi:hypothetical protein